MIDTDRPKFLEILNVCAVASRTELTKELIGVYWNALVDFEIADIERASAKHLRTSKFFPAIAEIVNAIPSNRLRHVGADEAWSIAKASFDESTTVIMTKEIAEARAIASELYDTDKTGARMAFKSAYDRILAATDTAPSWYVSEGYDKSRRIDAVKLAVQQGRLPHSTISKYRIEAPRATVAGLIEDANNRTGKINPAAIAKIKHLLSDKHD